MGSDDGSLYMHVTSLMNYYNYPKSLKYGTLLNFSIIFSSPGRSPGRAIVLPLALVLELASAASALAKSLTLKFFM